MGHSGDYAIHYGEAITNLGIKVLSPPRTLNFSSVTWRNKYDFSIGMLFTRRRRSRTMRRPSSPGTLIVLRFQPNTDVLKSSYNQSALQL